MPVLSDLEVPAMNQFACDECRQANKTRRHFLRMGALSFLGLNLADYLRLQAAGAAFAKPAKAKACILLWLEGGVCQLDTWDVKGNSGFKSISTNVPGIQISEALPSLARHMDKLAIIRSMRTLERNHAQATIETLTGHRPI